MKSHRRVSKIVLIAAFIALELFSFYKPRSAIFDTLAVLLLHILIMFSYLHWHFIFALNFSIIIIL